MYMVITAASTSSSVLDSEAWKARAAPWKAASTDSGIWPSVRSCAIRSCTALTAWPSDTPGAVLNEMVAAGSWPTWFTARAMGRSLTVATEDSGTGAPALEAT